MKFRLVVVPVLLLLFGCESPSNDSSAEVVAPDVAPAGFFTDLTPFHEKDKKIRTIGVKEGRGTAALDRINKRYELIIGPHKDLLKGAKIMDFGSYDGRWTYAALDAGAAHVTGIEINQEFTDQAEANLNTLGVSPDDYNFIVGDLLTELKKVEPGEYDGVVCAGVYYHITYHVELMNELKRLGLKWIIVDSSVVTDEKPVVQWSVAPYGLEGTPSASAIELIAEQAGFEYEYVPSAHFGTSSMWDYNGKGRITMLLQ